MVNDKEMIWRLYSLPDRDDLGITFISCDSNNASLQLPLEIALEALYNTYEKMSVIVVIPIVFAIGLIGNLGFLIVLLRLKHMRSMTNFYLGNLAVADLSFITIMTMRYTWFYANSDVDFDVSYETSIGCVISTFVVYLSVFSSFAFVTLVTIERYYAICKPLKNRLVRGKRHSMKLVAVTWLICAISAALYTPSAAILKSTCIEWPDSDIFDDVPTEIRRCEAMSHWMQPAAMYLKAIVYWTSLIITTIMGVKIIKQLTQRMALTKRHLHHEANNQTSSKSGMKVVRNQVAKMLIVNNVVFFIFHGFYHINNIVNIVEIHLGYYVIGIYTYQNLLWIGKVAAILNSSINPIIYNVINPRYREAFAMCFGIRRASSSAESPTNGSSSFKFQIPVTVESRKFPD